MRFIHKEFVYKAIGVIAAAAALIFAIVFAITAFIPIDVLKDWKLTGVKDTYTVGDDVVFTSTADKILNVNGTGKRYLVCGERQYEIVGTDAKRQTGLAAREIVVTIPRDRLPRQEVICYVLIVIDYEVYKFRYFEESARTADFKVLPEGV